jgi:hypothetical protein
MQSVTFLSLGIKVVWYPEFLFLFSNNNESKFVVLERGVPL